jgi:hypothetical protein
VDYSACGKESQICVRLAAQRPPITLPAAANDRVIRVLFTALYVDYVA